MGLSSSQQQVLIDRTGLVLVVLVALYLALQLVQDPALFIGQTVIGLTNGALIALIALGYTMVYGIIELINFAHGDVFMLGSMIGMQIFLWFGVTAASGVGVKIGMVLLALVACMAICGTLNITIERVAYRPLRGAPQLAPLITAIGMSFILSNVGQKIWGPSQRNVPDLVSDAALLGPVRVKDAFIILVTVPLLFGLTWFIQNTRQGKAMRATAQDREAAAIMGIDVDRTIGMTFLIGGVLAGASGVMFALFNTTTVWSAGFRNGLFAFTAAVLGGIGNLSGAVLGGVLLGLIASYSDLYLSLRWTEIVIFSILILVLVFRPTGLLGEQTISRA